MRHVDFRQWSRFDKERDAIIFEMLVDHRPIECIVPVEAVTTFFGGAFDNPLRGFQGRLDAIQDVARRLAKKQAPLPPRRLISTLELLSESDQCALECASQN